MTAHVFKITERRRRPAWTDYVARCSCGWSQGFEYRTAAERGARRHVESTLPTARDERGNR